MPDTRLSNRGFSLIELLIVIAIIGVIASIIMVSLEESRQKARNSARISQIREYQKAFSLYYTDTGYYPKLGTNETSRMCLGDYPTNKCWEGWDTATGGTLERPTIAAAIVPQYMGRIPIGEERTFGENGAYLGMVYESLYYGQGYRIWYFLEGNDRFCFLDGAVMYQNSGPDTLCILTVTP